MVEVVGRPVVDRDALRGQPVPAVEPVREERQHTGPGGVGHVVPADLAAVVRQAVGVRRRLREEHQADVLVGVAGQQDDVGRLDVLLTVLDVADAGRAALAVHLHAADVGLGDHLQASGLLGARDRRDGGRVLRVQVAAAAVAEAVIGTRRAVLVTDRVHRRGSGKRVPADSARRLGHLLDEAGPAQRGHRIRPAPRSLEDVAPLVDLAADVAGLPGDAYRVLDPVVVVLEIVEAEGPVLDRRPHRQARGAVAPRRLADHPEVPGAEAPALRPVVQRRAADRVHHRVQRAARRIGRRRAAAMDRDLAVRLLHRFGPAAVVVEELVRRVIARAQPGAGLQADHVHAGLGQRQHGDAAHRPEPNDHHVPFRKFNGHGSSVRGRR